MFEPVSPIDRRDARRALADCVVCATRLSNPILICEQVIAILHRTLGYERGAVVLRRDLAAPLVLVAHCPGQGGNTAQTEELQRVQDLLNGPTPGIIAKVIDSGAPVMVGDVRGTQSYIEGAAHIRSELCVPLTTGGLTIGAFNVEADQPDFFGDDDMLVMTTVAALLAGPCRDLPVAIYDRRAQQGDT